MPKSLSAVLLLVLISGCAMFDAPVTSKAFETPAWTITEGINNPESAHLDVDSGFLFISNVAGDSAAKDGVGWISKLTPDGKVITAQWVTGLNAPKGLRSHGGVLYVSDITEVVAIDIKTGQIKKKYECPDAGFVNDITAAADGSIYASDMLKSRIYRIKDGAVTVFAEGPQLEWPNGLLADGNRLICGGWGKPRGDTSTAIGHLYSLDLTTKQKTLITPEPLGNLDGIELDGRGGYYVTDWPAGKMFHVARDGKSTVLLAATRGTADIGLLPGKILLLPRMPESRIEAYRLDK